MKAQKFELKDPADIFLMMASLMADAAGKPKQEEAEEEPQQPVTVTEAKGINDFAIGKEVIIRTYSAGVWFGVLKQKAGNEVILTKARRMYK